MTTIIEKALEKTSAPGYDAPQPEGKEVAALFGDTAEGPLSLHYKCLEVIAELAAELRMRDEAPTDRPLVRENRPTSTGEPREDEA